MRSRLTQSIRSLAKQVGVGVVVCASFGAIADPLPVRADINSQTLASADTAYLSSQSTAFNIAAQPLGQALLAFAEQSGLALMFVSHMSLQQPSPALLGDMSNLDALSQLLAGSMLTFKQVEQGLVIVPKAVPTEEVLEPEPVLKPLLEEVLVIASKRAINLQDSPLTVTAISAQALEEREIGNVFTLREQVPSLQVARNGDHSASMLYLRGVGSDNYTEAGDSGVSTHIDGIYSSRSQGGAVMLYDLERIEVLRGPQGTLFGRNSTGGVINYHTARPTRELVAELDITVGNYERRKLEGMLNLPLTERWAVRTALASDRSLGYTDFSADSLSTDDAKRYNNTELMSYRLSSEWRPSQQFHWWLSHEHFEDTGNGSLPVVDYDTPVLIDTLGVSALQQDSYRSRFDWHLDQGLSLSYIVGYSDMRRDQNWDGDRNSAVGSEVNPLEYHQSNHTVWSTHRARQHELQLKNSDDSRLRWLLAYFDFSEKNGIRFDLEHQNADGSGWGGAPSHSFQQPLRGSEFQAFYGQLDLNINEFWTASVGARSGRDRRYDEGGRNIGCPDLIQSDRGGVIGPVAVNKDSAAAGQCYVSNYNDVSQTWRSSTYMARLEYRPVDEVLLYLLYAEGFKPGIVEDGTSVSGVYSGSQDPAFKAALAEAIDINNGRDEQTRAYVEPEASENLELGFKLDLLDGAMTLNGALFNTRYRDLQVSGVAVDADGIEMVSSTNAAAATIRGLELELNWASSLNGRFSGFVSLLDARYDQFLGADNNFPRYGQSWNPSANNAAIPDLMDFSGNQLKQAPSLSLGLNYSHRLPLANNLSLTPQLNVRYSDKVYFDEANRESRSGQLLDNRTGLWVSDPNGAANDIDFQPAYWLWGASLTLEALDGDWSLELYGRNLTNELVRYDVQSPELTSPEFYLAPPRTFGLHLATRFN